MYQTDLSVDNDDCSSTDRSLLKSLNTIKLLFDWGSKGKLKLKKTFRAPRELGPVHEKEAKKGHSGAAKLGRTISVSSAPRNVDFQRSKSIEPVTFVFCYGPEGEYISGGCDLFLMVHSS
jgi:hypothetical protein